MSGRTYQEIALEAIERAEGLASALDRATAELDRAVKAAEYYKRRSEELEVRNRALREKNKRFKGAIEGILRALPASKEDL